MVVVLLKACGGCGIPGTGRLAGLGGKAGGPWPCAGGAVDKSAFPPRDSATASPWVPPPPSGE